MDVETSESLISSKIETNQTFENGEDLKTGIEEVKTETGNISNEINQIEVIVPSTPLSANEVS